MSAWQLEYESMSSGFQKRRVVADRLSMTDGFLLFWEGHDMVMVVNLSNVVLCLKLIEGGPVLAPRRTSESEEEIFAPLDQRLRMRYGDDGARDPIGDAAREAARRFTPKVTSAEFARGELGGRCS